METTDGIPSKGTTTKYNRAIRRIMEKAPKTQADKFKEAAREHETDDSEEAFDAIVRRIAKSPPQEDDAKPRKGKR